VRGRGVTSVTDPGSPPGRAQDFWPCPISGVDIPDSAPKTKKEQKHGNRMIILSDFNLYLFKAPNADFPQKHI